MGKYQTRITRAGGAGGTTYDGGEVSSGIIVPDGAVTAPTYAFSRGGSNNTGWYEDSDHVGLAIAGVWRFSAGNNGLSLPSNNFIVFRVTEGGAILSKIASGGAGITDFRNSTTAQEIHLYETFTDASNYSRLAFRTAAGNHVITTEAAGTGTLRDITLGANGVDIEIPSTTASTSTSTGAVRVTGGMGLTGAVYAGGTVQGAQIISLNDVVASGGLSVGHSTFIAGAEALGDGTGEFYEAQVFGTSQRDSAVHIGCWSSTNTHAPALILTKSANGTIESNTIVAQSEVLGWIVFAADDGADYNTVPARIVAAVDDASPAASSIGGLLRLQVAAGVAANDLATALTVRADLTCEIEGDLQHNGSGLGFYSTTAIAQQTGVAVTDAGIHAACVALGLFTA